MTGDDLRSIPTWVDWRGNPPKVTIPAATRDALADLIDAVAEYRTVMSIWTPAGRGKVHQQTATRLAVYAALDALADR